jgi:GntR family transcriptional regulator
LAREGGRVSPPLLLLLDPESPFPPYSQIMMQVRGQIAGGRLHPGGQLPSVRQLARDLRLAPNTVARAYTELEREGWVATSLRRGVTVAPKPPVPADELRRRAVREAVAQLLAALRPLGIDTSALHAEIDRQLAPPEPDSAP